MTVRITQEKLWLSIFRLFALAMIILAIIGAAKTSGFKGYILADKLGGGVVLKGLQPECQLDVFTAAPSPL